MAKGKGRDHRKELAKMHVAKMKGNPIGKLEVVRRQIDTAIKLWFLGDDEVSVHTLAMSASNILLPIAKAKGVAAGPLDDSYIDEEDRPFFQAVVSFYHNFFKHASSDADETTPFNPAINTPVLMMAVASYGVLMNGELTPNMKAFHMRHSADNLEAYKESGEPLPDTAENLAGLAKLSKLEHWEKLQARDQ